MYEDSHLEAEYEDRMSGSFMGDPTEDPHGDEDFDRGLGEIDGEGE